MIERFDPTLNRDEGLAYSFAEMHKDDAGMYVSVDDLVNWVANRPPEDASLILDLMSDLGEKLEPVNTEVTECKSWWEQNGYYFKTRCGSGR